MSFRRDGLSALEGLISNAQEVRRLLPPAQSLPLAQLRTRSQPRRRFDAASLERLAESIRQHGVLQPLLVRPLGEYYEIVAGERRYRAAGLAGLTEVPVRVLEVEEAEAQTLALLENLQREDLNPYEETLALLDLLALVLGRSREEVVSLLYHMYNQSKGRICLQHEEEVQKVKRVFRTVSRLDWSSFVKIRLPLLRLPDELREALEAGEIAYTVALFLRRLSDPDLRREALERARAGESVESLRVWLASRNPAASPLSPVLRRLGRRVSSLELDSLPPEIRPRVEALLSELQELLLPQKAAGG